jgi:uncharacterized membrane protein YphA (DoxX/SURF4 family)
MNPLAWLKSGKIHFWTVGFVFAFAGGQKILQFSEFREFVDQMFMQFGIVRRAVLTIPFLEVLLGLALMTGYRSSLAAKIAIALLASFISYFIVSSLVPGMRIVVQAKGCGCGTGAPMLSVWLQVAIGIARNTCLIGILLFGIRRAIEAQAGVRVYRLLRTT